MITKIPCFVIIYYNFEVIKETLNFLISEKYFDIYVIENFSIYTNPLIKPFVIEKLKKKEIQNYYLFHKNISSNALELFFDSSCYKKIVNKSDYVLLTDGDIIAKSNNLDKNWLDEQKFIINKYADIDCCAINLSSENIPKNGPWDTQGWLAENNGTVYDDYIHASTGIHLVLFKKELFNNIIDWRKKNKQRFIDYNLAFYVNSINKRWAITKFNKGLHLTWDIYNDISHPYTQMKLKQGYNSTWLHFNYCFFTKYNKDGTKRTYYPIKAIKYYIKQSMPFLRNSKR